MPFASPDSCSFCTVSELLATGEVADCELAHTTVDPRAAVTRLTQGIADIGKNMGDLAREYGTRTAAHDLWDDAAARLQRTAIEQIFEQGLHQVIVDFIAANQQLGAAIAAAYRFVD